MPRPSQQEIARSNVPQDVILGSARRSASKPYFNRNIFPNTSNCQTLDAQISKLRDDKDLVYRGAMYGSKREVKDLLLAKELQFESLRCSQRLEDSSVIGTIDMTQLEFEKAEQRIIEEANKKRQTLLLVGGGVLLLGLAIFIK